MSMQHLLLQAAAALAAPPSPAPDCVVKLFENSDLTGTHASVLSATFSFQEWNQRTGLSSPFRSFTVSPGCSVSLFQFSDHSGWEAKFRSGTYPASSWHTHGALGVDAAALAVRWEGGGTKLVKGSANRWVQALAAKGEAEAQEVEPLDPNTLEVFSTTRAQSWESSDLEYALPLNGSEKSPIHCHTSLPNIEADVPEGMNVRWCYHTSYMEGAIDDYGCYADPQVQKNQKDKFFGYSGTWHTNTSFVWGPKKRGGYDPGWKALQGAALLPVKGYPFVNISGTISIGNNSRPALENSVIDWFLVYSHSGVNVDYRKLARGEFETRNSQRGINGPLPEDQTFEIPNVMVKNFTFGHIALWMRNTPYVNTVNMPGQLRLVDNIKFTFFPTEAHQMGTWRPPAPPALEFPVADKDDECLSKCKVEYAKSKGLVEDFVCDWCCDLSSWVVNKCTAFSECPATLKATVQKKNKDCNNAQKSSVATKVRQAGQSNAAAKIAKAKAALKQYNDQRELSAAAANQASSTEREVEMEQQIQSAETAMAAANAARNKRISSKTIAAATSKLLFKTGPGIDHMDEYLDEYKGVAQLGSGHFHPKFPNATAVVRPPAEPPMNITLKQPMPDWMKKMKAWTKAGQMAAIEPQPGAAPGTEPAWVTHQWPMND